MPSSITPTPPRVTCITHGVFELPTSTGEPIIFTVPAGYMLYIGEIAATAAIGNPGDWYLYLNASTAGVYRKINTTTWTLVTTLGGGEGGGTGTVTSVDVTVPSFLSVTGGPVTAAGTIEITLSGEAIPVDSGGLGVSTLTPYALIYGGTVPTGPVQSGTVGTAGQVLTSNGPDAIATFQDAPAGSGTVTEVTGSDEDGVEVSVASGTTTPGITVILTDISPDSVSTTGIDSSEGAYIDVATSMPALAIDVSKGKNTKTLGIDSTFTFSGVPSTGQTFKLSITNSDTTSHVFGIPSTFDINTQALVTEFTVLAGGTEEIAFTWDGSRYLGFGIPFSGYSAEEGIASAATTDIGASSSILVAITGTVTITSFGSAPAGTFRQGRFTGVLTLTHNGTSLIIPGGASIVTAANDRFEAYSLGSGNWIVTNYVPASQASVVSSAIAVGSAVSLSSTVASDVTSISLPAGDWDVEANVNFNLGSATLTTTVAGISLTTATIPTDGSEAYSGLQLTTTSALDSVTVSRKRVSVAVTTTVYLVAKQTFSAGTSGAFGSITARRAK